MADASRDPTPSGWSDAFAALPQESPPASQWPQIAARLDAPGHPERKHRHWLALAAGLCALAALPLAWTLRDAGSDDATTIVSVAPRIDPPNAAHVRSTVETPAATPAAFSPATTAQAPTSSATETKRSGQHDARRERRLATTTTGAEDAERLADGQQLAMGTSPQINVFRGDASQRPDERRVIRIECKDGDAECRRRAEARIGRPLPAFGDADAIRSASVFRFDCKPGENCEMDQHRLAEAFRWNGLNLASVDAHLGRYFGTDTGVLVLSTGPALGQLQAGDVIRRVDGKAVDTPRAVMDALRDKPADSTVAVEYLRDRVAADIQLKVPKAMSFPAMPPMPPAPPAPPYPSKAGATPLAPGAATLTHRRVVVVDKDGQVRTWEDDGNGAVRMPPAPPAPPVPPPPPRVD